MDTKKIFDETSRIGSEAAIERRKLEHLNKEWLRLISICPHEIVFKYMDNHPYKALIDGSYFCPACGKILDHLTVKQFNESDFHNSRVIPLTDLSLLGTKEVFQSIRKEVFDNMELYYNPENSIEELSLKMEDVLRDQQYDYYQDVALSLRRRKK